MIGHRFSKLGQGLYPAVGLRSRNEELCVNFAGPFRFDIDAYVEKARVDVEASVAAQTIERIPCMPERVEQMEAKTSEEEDVDMDVEASDTADIKEPTPIATTSVIHQPAERIKAAFILDYLKHNGHTAAFESTRSEMARRSWITTSARSGSEADDKLTTITEINRALALPDSAVPLELIGQILPSTSPLYHRMSVYQLLHLIQCAHISKDEGQEMEVIAYGRELRRKVKDQTWGSASKLLDEAFGLLVIELDEEVKSVWDQRRERDAESLDTHLRSECLLRRTTCCVMLR